VRVIDSNAKHLAAKSRLSKTPVRSRGAKSQATAAADARASLWSRPGFLVRRLLQIHNGLYFEACGDWNITPLQHGLLVVLRGNPDGLDIQSLAAELGVDRSNLADVARRLKRRGLIMQAEATNDRRMLISRITKAGVDLLDDIAPAMIRSQVKLLAPLDAETKRLFVKAIAELVTIYNDKGRAKLRL
jgi:DNA-binding MarR family transcriptional regulator